MPVTITTNVNCSVNKNLFELLYLSKKFVLNFPYHWHRYANYMECGTVFIPWVAAWARWLLHLLKVARSNSDCGWAAPIYAMHEGSGGTAREGGAECDQSIGSTVSDAIVCSWLWSTAARSSPLGYFSNYCK